VTDIFFWLIATVVSAGFLLGAPSLLLFLLVLVPGGVSFIGLWINLLNTVQCQDNCPPGRDVGMALVGPFVVAATLIFVSVALVRGAILYLRERSRVPVRKS
jgi:formate-dependent nitrite reductase membrane component NrfD